MFAHTHTHLFLAVARQTHVFVSAHFYDGGVEIRLCAHSFGCPQNVSALFSCAKNVVHTYDGTLSIHYLNFIFYAFVLRVMVGVVPHSA